MNSTPTHQTQRLTSTLLPCLLFLASCNNGLNLPSQTANQAQEAPEALTPSQQKELENLMESSQTSKELTQEDIPQNTRELVLATEYRDVSQVNLPTIPPSPSPLVLLSSPCNQPSTTQASISIPSSLSDESITYSSLSKLTQASKANSSQEPSKERRHTELPDQASLWLGNLDMLPRDILKLIFSYVGPKEIGKMRQPNRAFYQLMTGYEIPGVLGVKHQRQSSIYIDDWIESKVIDFKKERIETIPSFPFFRLVGAVRNLPPAFWPYLKGTNVHTVDLYGNYIGDSGAEGFAKYLKDTNVHTVNLGCNEIGDSGAEGFAKHLKGTNVHTVDLYYNQLGDSGAEGFAKHLPGTNVHTVNLRFNEIGDSGVDGFAKQLPGTNVHTVNLGFNEIGASGAEGFAKHLKGTNVHTVSLAINEIGDSGAEGFAKHLQGTNVHTVSLEHNHIGALGAKWFAKHLKGTKVHTVDLRHNKIGDSGAKWFAKHLPGTNVHTVDLSLNQIGDLGAEGFAKQLRGTNVHTVNLGFNSIGPSGAERFAKHLPGTNVHTVNLTDNEIDTEAKEWLKSQYPNITWIF